MVTPYLFKRFEKVGADFITNYAGFFNTFLGFREKKKNNYKITRK